MTTIERSDTIIRAVLAAGLVVLLFVLATAVAGADTSANERLERKVRVMERVLDEVLVQSPNALIAAGGGNTRGLVLEEFGALFTLEANLGGGLLEISEGGRGIYVSAEDGFLTRRRPRDRDGEETEEGTEAPWTDLGKLKEEATKRADEKLAKLRTELTDALVDYGATLTELEDDQYVAVAAFLGGRGLFSGSDDRRLVLKVMMRDLRQHASGALSREAVIAKVKVEER